MADGAAGASKTGATHLRVLLVEDHRELAETTGAFLESRGHVVDYAADGLVALHLGLTGDYDVIVLDILLPGPDGLEVCRRLRQDARLGTPIIMLTAREMLEDKLAGFDAGADDYLVKPFDMPELVARVEALARRSRGLVSRFEIGDLVVDADARQVTRAGRPVALSRTAFTILYVLARAHPKVVSRRELERVLWDDDPPDSDALRSHLYNLRRAVDRPFAAPLIHTVTGSGYCIRS